jgi:flagellar hook-length control protein FliK
LRRRSPPALQSAPAATLQVYNRIIERADGRAQRFEIRLDPAELGRVDVRIEIGADKKVHAVLAAHDSAALSDLMRGQRALERALTDAGLDLADKGVRFELASDNDSSASQQRNGAGNGRDAQANVWRRFETMTMPATAETAAVAQPSWRPQRLDLVA